MATYRLEVERDTDPLSPEEWENGDVFLVCDTRYFGTRAKAPHNEEEYERFGVKVYGSSGYLTLRLYDEEDADGYVYVKRDVGFTDSEAAAKSMLQEWQQYLDGEVYGYVVWRDEVCSLGHTHSEIVESCWGFYGDERYAREEGESMLAAIVQSDTGE